MPEAEEGRDVATFLQRCRRGEGEAVWAELLAAGEAAGPGGRLEREARSVARETMRRARVNVERLVPRLTAIGYRFGTLGGDDDGDSGAWYGRMYPVYRRPRKDIGRRLDRAEAAYGPLPLALRAWYEQVREVNFLGSHPRWARTSEEVRVLDPLCAIPWRDAIAGFTQEYREWADDGGAGADRPAGPPFAPDDYQKADLSGGPEYRARYPAAAADAPLLNERHRTTLVGYLRTCFRWDGFPGFERLKPAKRPAADIALLTEGLPPL